MPVVPPSHRATYYYYITTDLLLIQLTFGEVTANERKVSDVFILTCCRPISDIVSGTTIAVKLIGESKDFK